MKNPLILIALLAAIVFLYAGYRLALLRAHLKFEQWKNAYSKQIRRGAISGSQAAVAGRIFERVAPYLPGFGYSPRDVRFLGDPVDFVVFDGLSEGNLRNVVFVEVKTGEGDLNGNERMVKAAITERRVAWSLFRMAEAQPRLADDELSSLGNRPDERENFLEQRAPRPRRSAIIDRGRF